MASAESMANESMARDDYRRDLGDGLVLRWSIPEDMERVTALYAHVLRRNADEAPTPYASTWTRDMFSGRHPHIGPRDFAVVEDTRSGALLAATCLLGYTCAYEGIPFGFGRPELVVSLPEYRRQGLVRAIFELVHARSAARRHLAQGITGIANFYRQFGYEYAAPLEEDTTVYFPAIPALKSGAADPYTLRAATLDDLPQLGQLWTRAQAGAGLWSEIEADYWRWAMVGTHPDALERWRVYMIVGADDPGAGRPVGALILAPWRWSAALTVSGPFVDANVPLVRVMSSVLRGVRALAETVRPTRPEIPAAGAITFRWGGPALRGALGDTPRIDAAHPYPWYLRVADLPGFLRHVTPALERRLASSAHAGYTGELTLDLYRGGVRLAFEQGKLTTVEDWQRPVWGEGMAGYPPLVFVQALFGYRSLDELRHIYPDVWAEGDAVALLETLFPKRPSLLIPLE